MTDSYKFEEKLDRLIELCQQLKQENQALREREAGLVGERSQLIEKNEMARQKIETMINRLRNLSVEQESWRLFLSKYRFSATSIRLTVNRKSARRLSTQPSC